LSRGAATSEGDEDSFDPSMMHVLQNGYANGSVRPMDIQHTAKRTNIDATRILLFFVSQHLSHFSRWNFVRIFFRSKA